MAIEVHRCASAENCGRCCPLPATKEPLTLRFAYGREDGSVESDGISFVVLVDGKEVFNRNTDEKKWHEAAADLTRCKTP